MSGFRISVLAVITLSALVSRQPGNQSPPACHRTRGTEYGKTPVLEMVFVLDTTDQWLALEGEAAHLGNRKRVCSRPHPQVQLVWSPIDRGDEYVTQVPLPRIKVYTTLMDYSARGGGGGPENVRRTLADGVSAGCLNASGPVHFPRWRAPPR